jgi:hypothetical protein
MPANAPIRARLSLLAVLSILPAAALGKPVIEVGTVGAADATGRFEGDVAMLYDVLAKLKNDPAALGLDSSEVVIQLAAGATYALDPSKQDDGRLVLPEGTDLFGKNEYVDDVNLDGLPVPDGIWDPIGTTSTGELIFANPTTETIIDASRLTSLAAVVSIGLHNTVRLLTVMNNRVAVALIAVNEVPADGGMWGEVHDCILANGLRGLYFLHAAGDFAGVTSHAVFQRNISRRHVPPRGFGFQIQAAAASGGRMELTLLGNRAYANPVGVFAVNLLSSDVDLSVSSRGNVYERNNVGVLLYAGISGGEQNKLSFESLDDAIWNNVGATGVDLAGGIHAAAAIRASPAAPTSNDNTLRIRLLATRFVSPTPSDPQNREGTQRRDARIYGGHTLSGAVDPGTGNVTELLVRQALSDESDATPDAFFCSASFPSQPVGGPDNRLTIFGSPNAFERTNTGIIAPPADFFSNAEFE